MNNALAAKHPARGHPPEERKDALRDSLYVRDDRYGPMDGSSSL